jgi:hypothetical protein
VGVPLKTSARICGGNELRVLGDGYPENCCGNEVCGLATVVALAATVCMGVTEVVFLIDDIDGGIMWEP